MPAFLSPVADLAAPAESSSPLSVEEQLVADWMAARAIDPEVLDD
ncbi:hypothetical protein [Streptomyces atriruber]|nr:hypothetical protein [Streptomyces atriruber]